MHSPKPPLSKGGGFASGKTGGIPQAGRFPHGFVLSESACCNPSVTATPCQLPLAREPWGAVENKGPVVLLAAVVKPRLFGCKLRLHEMPRQDFPAGVCQLFLLLFPKGTKKNRENRDRIRHRPGLFTARFKG